MENLINLVAGRWNSDFMVSVLCFDIRQGLQSLVKLSRAEG